ncbi:formyltransferase family protein, partial [Streptococcus pyogenes]
VPESGVTIHWVDSGVDTGQIIKQVRVPRLPDDTIESFENRIHQAEYAVYPQVIKEILHD